MKQKTLTPLFAVAAITLATVGTGCSSVSGNKMVADQDRNFLGLIKYEPGSFAKTPPYTLELHSNDVIERPDVTGDRVTLLEGFFTYEDY